jgi:hypothetical protein
MTDMPIKIEIWILTATLYTKQILQIMIVDEVWYFKSVTSLSKAKCLKNYF